MWRFILYFIIFLILFRALRSFFSTFLKSKSESAIKSQAMKKKSKFDNVEDAKYIEIKPDDDKKN
jgi:hypothetical protein